MSDRVELSIQDKMIVMLSCEELTARFKSMSLDIKFEAIRNIAYNVLSEHKKLIDLIVEDVNNAISAEEFPKEYLCEPCSCDEETGVDDNESPDV